MLTRRDVARSGNTSCKWFLETDPVYRTQLKKVWLWNKWPGKWGPDAGIDLVAQAKAYAPENTVTKQDMFRHR